jgi:hypothetical protein
MRNVIFSKKGENDLILPYKTDERATHIEPVLE